MKTLHEWGYHFNESRQISDLTATQKRMIGLAERAEGYIKRQKQQQNQQNGPINTKSNLENRRSKRKRIEQAKQRKMN